jgi:hypothetical protein
MLVLGTVVSLAFPGQELSVELTCETQPAIGEDVTLEAATDERPNGTVIEILSTQEGICHVKVAVSKALFADLLWENAQEAHEV